ncbi:MAG: hypothetical protein KA368_19320 [Acidobacteria bacterium]|nr:hypothetical protein [Acidobacteriota bacterium]
MPKIKFVLFSQRDRRVTDRVDTFILNGKRIGPVRDERGIKPTSRLFTADIPPDIYELQVEVPGFKLFRGTFEVKLSDPANSENVVKLNHMCLDLPEFSELSAAQQNLLKTFDPGTSPDQIWQGLGDNQAATFFQLSHTLANTKLNNGRTLDNYVESVRRIGGAEVEDFDLSDPESEKIKSSVGWRMHVTISRGDRRTLVRDLMENGVFGGQDGFTHSTHSRFGLNKSHRQNSELPKLQLVLSDNNEHSDVDLDVEFDRSSPHEVFDRFIARFPEVAPIYRF